jgi:hypothetical protein
MTDPVTDYDEFLKKGEAKRTAAIEHLKKTLAEQRAEVRNTEARIAALEGREAGTSGKRKRRRSSYIMTPEHKEKLRKAREKRRREKQRA